MSFTEQVMEFFRRNPGVWIQATRLEDVGGRQAWRTRVSEARLRFVAAREGDIKNRCRRVKGADGRVWTLSEYVFEPFSKTGQSSHGDSDGQLVLI